MISQGALLVVPGRLGHLTNFGVFDAPNTPRHIAQRKPGFVNWARVLASGTVMLALGDDDDGWLHVLTPHGPGWVYTAYVNCLK